MHFSKVIRKIKFYRKFIGFFLIVSFFAIFGFFAVSEGYTYFASKDRIVNCCVDLPEENTKRVGLVLGCTPKLGKWENMYFVHRMNVAAELWKSGKVSCLIVSGDNSKNNYNEPEAMKEALMSLEVPEKKIICDYAGFRTLDSVVRAKEIFGATNLVIVSQKFHNERALAIANSYGIDALAVNANDIKNKSILIKTWLRERGARLAMIADLWIFDTEPKYLGKKIALPLEEEGQEKEN